MKNFYRYFPVMFVISALATSAIAAPRTVEDRLSDLEAQSALNSIKISGYFINRFDYIKYLPQNDESQKNLVRAFSMRLHLNVDADVSDQIKFYSTIAMSKLYNAAIRQQDPMLLGVDPYRDFSGGNAYNSSAAFIDKAYLDYHFQSIPFTFSVGRLPTVNGPNTHWWDARARMGTYPKMSYNAIFDGLGLTFKGSKFLPDNHNFNVRALYTPVGQFNLLTPYIQATAFNGTEKLVSTLPMYTVMGDYSLKGGSIFSEWNTIIQYYSTAGGIQYPRDTALPTSSGTMYLYSDLKTTVKGLTIYTELDDILKSGFDLSFSYYHNWLTSDGQVLVRPAAQNPGATPVGAPAPGYTTGDRTGNAVLAAARYRLPIPVLKRPYIGAELLVSDKNYFLADSGKEDLTGFYMTRGNAKHFWYTQPITDSFSLRVGYRGQDYHSVSNSLIQQSDSHDQIKTIYLNARLDF